MKLLGLGARRRYFCQAQGNPWTHHYHWFMFIQRWIRINYFVVCSIQVSELFTLLPVTVADPGFSRGGGVNPPGGA